MKKIIGKVLKVFVSIMMIFWILPEIALAENQAYDYKYTGEITWGLKDSGTGLLKIDGHWAYCVDRDTLVQNGHMYARTTLNAAGYYSAEDADKIRSILKNSYPTITLAALQTSSNITNLSEKEAITGTQYAIWGYANNDVSYTGSNDNVKSLITYLNGLAPSGAYATEPITFTVNAYQQNDTVIFDYSASTNIGALQNKVITVTNGSTPMTSFTDDGTKVIVDTTNINTQSTLTFKISGSQLLQADVYFYDPQGGRDASQSLISYFEGSSNVSNTSQFTYQPATTTVNLKANKIYNKAINANDFTFKVLNSDNSVVKTATANSNGDVIFGDMVFTKAQKGQTFNYKIVEVKGTNPGITYDQTIYDVSITPQIVNGAFSAVVVYKLNGNVVNQAKFTNSYYAKPTEANLSGYKTLENKTLVDGMFNFKLMDANKTEIRTVSNLANGNIDFGKVGPFNEAKDYIYYIQEVVPQNPTRGIQYDTNEYKVIVRVTDNGQGQLVANVIYPNEGGKLNVKNIYQPLPTSAEIVGNKTLTGRPLKADEFKFMLKENGQSSETLANVDANGKFSFNINYTKVGRYTYQISEVPGTLGGVTYTNAVLQVTVDVIDDNGQLVATVNYPETGLKFNNTYQAKPIGVNLEARKTLDNMALVGGEFHFYLYQGTQLKGHASNDATGNIKFAELVFNQVGEYRYTIKEDAGNIDGITYDQRTYNVLITVTDDLNGRLVAEVTYDEGVEAIEFANTYKTSVYINLQKQLIGRTLVPGEFEFVLNKDDSQIATASNDLNGNIVFGPLMYDQEGTYEYVIFENNNQTGGISYDLNRVIVNVVVTKDNTGKLVAEVQYPRVNYFMNSYKAEPVQVSLQATKTLSGTGLTLQKDMFNFELIDQNNNVVQTKSNDASGLITFDNLEFKQAGTYTYKIKEVAQAMPGVTYDDKTVDVVIVVTDDLKGSLVADVQYPNAVAKFENSYLADSTYASIIGQKNLTGKTLNAQEFAFELYDDEGTVIDTANNNLDGSFSFDPITYNEVGEYLYHVKEVTQTNNGITYDTHIEDITVVVSDNGTGKLSAEVIYDETGLVFNNTYDAKPTSAQFNLNKTLTGQALTADKFTFVLYDEANQEMESVGNKADGSINFTAIEYSEVGTYNYQVREINDGLDGYIYDAQAIDITVTVEDDLLGHLQASVMYHNEDVTFENSYQPNATSAAIVANKTLTGQAIKIGQFSFALMDDQGNIIQEVQNGLGGSVEFAAIVYEEVGTYNYSVKELEGVLGGINYDKTIYNVTVEVTDDNNGHLVARVIYPNESITFVNEYTTKPVKAAVDPDKRLLGRPLLVGEFSFELIDDQGEVVEVINNGPDESFIFTPLEYTAPGVYNYTVREVQGNLPGITYDDSVYRAVVTVVDNAQGQLVATMTYPDGDPTFINTYTPKAVDVDLSVNKVLTGRVLTSGMFSFDLLDSQGELIEVNSNNDHGKINFRTLTFTEVGTYNYQISENDNGMYGITYDDTIVDIAITVTDNLNGELVADVTYPEKQPNFTNSYLADDVSIDIVGQKNLSGKDLNAQEFEFELYDDEGTKIETTSNNLDGSFSFAPITYKAVGEYQYTVKEVTQTNNGITYDTHIEDITVVVSDNGTGKLSAEVIYDETGLVFNNTYDAKPTSAQFNLNKTLTGQALTADKFTFVLYDEANQEMESVGNKADGSINFTAIEYSEVGTYNYQVREINDGLDGYIYDAQAIDITVTVEDDLLGHLQASVMYHNEDVTFENSYQPNATSAAIVANKTLTGQAIKIGQFSFALMDDQGNIIQEVQNGLGGSVEFAAIVYEEVGTYQYSVKEVQGSLGGIKYDKTIYNVTVEVTDDNNGHLVARVIYPNESITFVNEYTTKPVKAAVDPDKKLVGRPLVAGEFSFELIDAQGKVVEVIKNGPDESFIFTPLEYSAPGVYNYTVREVQGNLPGITYDKSVWPAVVTVVDNAQGQLVATISYPNGDPTFVNVYTPKAVGVDLVVSKVLTGRVLTSGMFSFNLVDSQGKLIQTISNNDSGKVNFTPLTFTSVGTYKYQVYENKNGAYGITYDNTPVDIVITVTDNLNGQLVANVTYPTKQPNFTNKYTPNIPRTNDVTNINIMFILLVASLGGIGIIGYRKKMK